LKKGVWFGINHGCYTKNKAIPESLNVGNRDLTCWDQNIKADLLSVHDPDEYLSSAKDCRGKKQKLNDILEAYRALFELKQKGEIKALVSVPRTGW